MKEMGPEPSRQFEIRVFTTAPDSPEDGRTLVWSRTKWFERVEEENGSVAFSPASDSEEGVRQWLLQETSQELTELDDDYARTVREEFLEQAQLYPEAAELSDEPPFLEQRVD